MVKEQTVQTRDRAIGMLHGGLAKIRVAKQICVSIRTLRRWWLAFLGGQSLENKRGRGRKHPSQWQQNWSSQSLPRKDSNHPDPYKMVHRPINRKILKNG